MILSDEFNRMLGAPNILGLPASSVDDVVMRVKAMSHIGYYAEAKAIAESGGHITPKMQASLDSFEYLKGILHNPDEVMGSDYIAKEVSAYFEAANRMDGFGIIVDDPKRWLGLTKSVTDATGKKVTNPALKKIMDNPYDFMKNPGKYIDDKARAAQLKEMIDTAEIPWDDFRMAIGGQERSIMAVASDLFGYVLQHAVPVTARAARGQWNATHPMATLGNVMFRMHRGLLRHGLTHFYLLTRPAYTGYNQVMNFNMMLLQNPLLTFRNYLEPASNIRRYAKELWGLEDVPAYVEQGFGYGYMMGREELEEIARMQGKTLPLIGEGTFAKGIRDIAKEYHAVVPTERPWIERAPFVGPLFHRAGMWVRGVNVGGEQYFRSGTYMMEHYKTFNRMQRELAKEMGIKDEWLLSLSQFPDQLKNFVSGTPIPAEHVMPRHLLGPYEMSVIDNLVSELPKDYTILDIVGAVKTAKKTAAQHYDELNLWYALRSGPKEAAKALDTIALGDVENAMRMAGYADEEVRRNLEELTRLMGPQERAFWEHVQARPWAAKEKLYMEKYSSAEHNVVWDRRQKLDEVFVDKIRVVAASHHAEALRLVNQAREAGTEAFQKDVSAIYAKMGREKTKLYDMWSEQVNKLWDDAITKAEATGGGLPLGAMDSPVLMEADQINNLLKMHGMEDMLNLEETAASQMLGKVRKEGMASLDRFESQLLVNWEGLLKADRTALLGESGSTVADLVRIRNTSLAYAKREGTRVSQYALFNYASRTNVDWAMSTLMPYPYWQTRFILHWATRCIDHPSQFNALVVLMKHWGEATKDLPTFLMASPIKLDLPDGSQVRFSPSMYFFPLSYTGLEVLRYGDQINDLVDGMAMLQDFVGGYMYPTVEMAMGLMSYSFDAPGYRSRGIGVAKNPTEIVKDILPQLKLLRGALGHNPSAVRWGLEHNMFTETDIAMAIRAMGDALNSGELTDVEAVKDAIRDLQDRRPNPLALKYLGQMLQRRLWTDSARYSGIPASKWYPEQQNTHQLMQLLYPDDSTPPAPDVQRQLLAAYPGLEVTRGVTVPAGLNRSQEDRWQASKRYYDTVDAARQQFLVDDMKELMDDFESPEPGATISASDFIGRRRSLYDQYRGVILEARSSAARNNAPIETDDRELFWREVGRPVWPKHPLDELVDQYYEIEAVNFPGTTAQETDWQAFFTAREDFMALLAPWEKKWLEDYLEGSDLPDAAFRAAQKTVRPYWAIRDALIAKDPNLKNLLKQLEYWTRVDPAMAEMYANHPTIKRFNSMVSALRRNMRLENVAIEAALVKWWGYSSIYA